MRSKRDFQVSPETVLKNIAMIRANYYGKISIIDHWIGRILEAFKRKGLLDDLLVVLVSDHGEMLGDHGRIHKFTFHESSVRIPLAMSWPGRIEGNTVTNALVEIVDVFPTLLEAAGCKPSHRCLGRSLWPVIRQPDGDIRDYQLSEIDYSGFRSNEIEYGGRHIMIRSRRHKYVVDETAVGY